MGGKVNIDWDTQTIMLPGADISHGHKKTYIVKIP